MKKRNLWASCKLEDSQQGNDVDAVHGVFQVMTMVKVKVKVNNAQRFQEPD